MNFYEFCDINGFIGFSVGQITTTLDNGDEKKKMPDKFRPWKNLTTTTLYPNDKTFCVKTGKESNITVVDFDDINTLEEFDNTFPYIKEQCFKVRTRSGGIHYYFKYNPEILTTSNANANDCGIDFRNDGGMIISHKTEVLRYNGEKSYYNYEGGEILEMPTDVFNWLNLKCENFLIHTSIKKNKKKLIIENNNEDDDKITETESYDETEIIKRKENIRKDLKKIDRKKFETHENYYKLILAICDELGYKDFDFCKEITKDYCNEKKYAEFDNWFKSLSPRLNGKKITYGTIKHWLQEELMYNIENTVLTSGSLADIFIGLYGEDFITVDDTLYCWNGIYWEKSDKKYSKLITKIDKDFIKFLLNHQVNLPRETEEEIKKIGKYVISVGNFRNQTKRAGLVTDIITFSKPNKPIQFDKNPYLLAFNNKIFDLKTGKEVVPNRSDYISITTGYDWKEPKKEETEKVTEILKQILPIDSVADYYLQVLSTCLSGIHLQYMFIASGVGGNGKSVLDSLLLSALGDYGYKIPSSLLQQDLKSGASPEVANLNNKRFALGSEPSSKRKFAMSVIKELSGCSSINSRTIYSDNCKVNLKLTLIVECNDKPDLDEVNEAVERRLRVINFISKFVSDEDYELLKDDIKNIYKRNGYYDTDEFRESHRCAFIKVLMSYFIKFSQNSDELPKIPEEVKHDSEKYMKCSDNVYEWFMEKYEKAEKSIIYLKDIYNNYKLSEGYKGLSRQKQGDLTQDKFISKLESNLHLKKQLLFKKRNDCVDLGGTKSTQISKDGIYGWKRREEEEGEYAEI
jgi:P4 family phage/plasmid primase-like protien